MSFTYAKQDSSVLRHYKIQELISLREIYVEIIQLIFILLEKKMDVRKIIGITLA